MTDDRLLEIMTTAMEGWGMPQYGDKFPAMEILQLVKDAGYAKQLLAPLDENEIKDIIYTHFLDKTEARRMWIVNAAKAICAEFGPQENKLEPLDRTAVLGRLGAIYCLPEHSHKEIDSELMISIADMLVKEFGTVTDRVVSVEDITALINTHIATRGRTSGDKVAAVVLTEDFPKLAQDIWNSVYGANNEKKTHEV